MALSAHLYYSGRVAEEFHTQLKALLATSDLPDLGPGPRSAVSTQSELDARLKAILRDGNIASKSSELIRSLLLLWHDHLDASHIISQSIENADGSLLHAIMHRREPDYWNSKYWWRRVGKHPSFSEMGKRVAAFLKTSSESDLSAKLVPNGQWDPFAFVDVCESVAGESQSSPRVKVLREIQKIETEVALDYFLAH